MRNSLFRGHRSLIGTFSGVIDTTASVNSLFLHLMCSCSLIGQNGMWIEQTDTILSFLEMRTQDLRCSMTYWWRTACITSIWVCAFPLCHFNSSYWPLDDAVISLIALSLSLSLSLSLFSLGYVQGMSDLLSPLLFVTQNEVESFWCLTGFMDLVVSKHTCFLIVLFNRCISSGYKAFFCL